VTYWVLDTWVLATCDDYDCDACMDCILLLMRIKSEDGICLDHGGLIEKEYTPYFSSRLVSTWWKHMKRTQGKIHHCSSHLPSRHLKRLSRMKFHNDDVKFVGSVFNSPHKKLVACESDYNTRIKQYLKTYCNIDVLHPCQCYP
jgi:hypothetical protein